MIFIIVPVYNRKELTRQCLLSLQAQTMRDFCIIVVNDGSSDGTGDMLRQEFPEATVLEGDGNFFWTKSINVGIEHVLKECSTDDYILTLNNDLIVKEQYLECMLSCAHKNAGALIGSVVVDQKSGEVTDGGVLVNWWTAKFVFLKKGKAYDKVRQVMLPREVDVVSGRGTLIPISVFHDIGVYAEKALPQYLADYEFSVRAKNNGYCLVFQYEASVFSHTEETGLNNQIRRLSWGQWIKSFVSMKSPNALRYRWRFALRSCRNVFQSIVFFVCDLVRVFLGSFRNQIFIKG